MKYNNNGDSNNNNNNDNNSSNNNNNNNNYYYYYYYCYYFIQLPDGKVIKSLQECESYRYLGILEADKFLEEKMKLMMMFRRNILEG